MENKEVYIDGVNVSGCDFCEWKSSNIPQCRIRLASFESTCKGYKCYYKQLKLKEQECEETKQYAQDIYDFWQSLIESFDILQGEKTKLEQECEELKIYIESNRQQVKEVETLVMDNDRLINELDQLKQTFTEIKKIAERGFQHSQCNCGAKADLDLIIQKICEAINE